MVRTSKGTVPRAPTIIIAIFTVLILWTAGICLEKASGATAKDNLQYKQWCEETFVNGAHIYEAYKDIAFNITHVPELNGIDHWQTPAETAQLKTGDCEDAVFLFYSHLPPDQPNAAIVWGWIIDRESNITTAHVWYQLTSKRGRQYIVEGFSGDWNGIIPHEISRMKEARTRITVLEIQHFVIPRLVKLPLSGSGYEYIACPSNIIGRGADREISNIFEKLFELFSRDSDQIASPPHPTLPPWGEE